MLAAGCWLPAARASFSVFILWNHSGDISWSLGVLSAVPALHSELVFALLIKRQRFWKVSTVSLPFKPCSSTGLHPLPGCESSESVWRSVCICACIVYTCMRRLGSLLESFFRSHPSFVLWTASLAWCLLRKWGVTGQWVNPRDMSACPFPVLGFQTWTITLSFNKQTNMGAGDHTQVLRPRQQALEWVISQQAETWGSWDPSSACSGFYFSPLEFLQT